MAGFTLLFQEMQGSGRRSQELMGSRSNRGNYVAWHSLMWNPDFLTHSRTSPLLFPPAVFSGYGLISTRQAGRQSINIGWANRRLEVSFPLHQTTPTSSTPSTNPHSALPRSAQGLGYPLENYSRPPACVGVQTRTHTLFSVCNHKGLSQTT